MDLEAITAAVVESVNKMSTPDVLEDLKLLTPEQVSEMLQIAKSTVYNLVNRGELPSTKIGASVRFRPRALYAYMLIREKTAQPQVVAA